MKSIKTFSSVTVLALVHCLPFLSADEIDGGSVQDRTCMLMLENFAVFSANYTYCTISHARPITICRECVSWYLSVVDVYNDITEIESRGGQKCENELANLDRLQVFESGFKYIKDMWRRGYCDTCFVHDPVTGRPTKEPTVLVKQILNATAVYRECVEKHHNSSIKPDMVVCDLCADSYQQINAIYNNYKATSGGIDYCMDIVDLINSTRNEWSDDMGCCKSRQKTELVFLLSSLGIGSLPVFFYLMTYAFTPKKEHTLIERKRWNEDSATPKSSEDSPPVIS